MRRRRRRRRKGKGEGAGREEATSMKRQGNVLSQAEE